MQSLKYKRPMTLNSKDMYYKIRVCDKSSVPSPLHAKINFLNFKDMLITILVFRFTYFHSDISLPPDTPALSLEAPDKGIQFLPQTQIF